MSIVHTYAVGNGDMFSIRHGSDNFTIIDSSMCVDDQDWIVRELEKQKAGKRMSRFISTHPDQDHLMGLEHLDEQLDIWNFYCIKNNVIKDDETDDFKHYKKLRDSDKAFFLYKGCRRKWLNDDDDERGSSGLNILWPDTSNADFKAVLADAEKAGSPNNTSIIMAYSVADSSSFLWLGDLETEFMELIEEHVNWPHIDVLFAAHHGRKSGRVPGSILATINPGVIVIGQGPAEDLHYYEGYNTISQNSAGTIAFEAVTSFVDVYVSNNDYSVGFLEDRGGTRYDNYIGSLKVG